MAATAEAVPDEDRRGRWETGFAVDQGEYEEPGVEVDSDFEFERVTVEERNAHARVKEQSIAAATATAAARHCKDEEELAGDVHARLQCGLLTGTKRKAAAAHAEPPATGAEIQDINEEYSAEDNYARIGAGLPQGSDMEATARASKLQPISGPEIHDNKCSRYKKDHQVAAEEENVGVATSEIDGKMTAAAQEPVEEPSSGGATNRHCDEEEVSRDCYVQLQGGLLGRKRKASVTLDEPQTTGIEIQDEQGHEEYVPWDCYVRLQGGFLGRKRKAIATHAEPQTTRTEIQDEKGEHNSDDNGAPTGVGLQGRKREATVTPGKVQATTGPDKTAQGECLRAENEMLKQQLVRKTKELEAEAEKIRRLKLELDVKDKEIKSLEKQNEELRCEREHYRKIAKPPRNPSQFCKEHALGQDCPERHGSASSEQDEGGDSY